MKRVFVLILFISNISKAQQWEAEIFTGVSGYSGDLSDDFNARTLGPSIHFNLNYPLTTRFVLRGGLAWGKLTGSDQFNKADLQGRNLDFKTNLFEANLCIEVNLLTPDLFSSYPYVFGGIGLFHFNPYSKDKNGTKVLLKPLSTEGEGFPEYPDKKKYSLWQPCIPVGGGIKKSLNDKYEIAFEFGFRKLFTDYLDDVSTTYVDQETLFFHKGEKAVEMASRNNSFLPHSAGEIRGNPKKKDWYYFTGFKLLMRLGEGSDGRIRF